MQPTEIWKPIDNEPGYDISNLGRVRTYKRRGRGGLAESPILLRPWKTRLGYPMVTLNARRKAYVHRLVAEAFLPEPGPGQVQVAHRDGDPANPHMSNLRWATVSENQQDRVLHGTSNRGEGGAHVVPQWLIDQVREMHGPYMRGNPGKMTQAAIARTTGLDARMVGRIVRGETWRHTGKYAHWYTDPA